MLQAALAWCCIAEKRMPRLSRVLSICLFALGAGFLLYPISAKMWSAYCQKQVISSYEQQVSGEMNQKQCKELWQQAKQFEEQGDAGEILYEQTLSVTGSDVMGTLVIPKIDVDLPIYHGTEDAVLQKGVGHLQKSDLPIGGKGNHCVLTGHRGLPSAKLFTRLDELSQGDRIYLKVLDHTLAYEVSRIYPMIPKDDLKKIHQITAPRGGEDLVTMVTCTPYGVNTHRLLVQASRVEYKGELEENKEGNIQEKTEVPRFLGGILVLIAAVVIGGIYRVKKLGVLLLCGLLMAGMWTGYSRAADAVDMRNTCSLTIQGAQQSEEIPVSVFCVATWSENGGYQLSSDFTRVNLNKLTEEPTTEELRKTTEDLKNQSEKLPPMVEGILKDGVCSIGHLQTGIYLVVPKNVSAEDGQGTYRFSPSLVELPQNGKNPDGTLQLKGELVKVTKSPKTGEYY